MNEFDIRLILEKNDIKLDYNDELLMNFIEKIELNDVNIDKLRKINWDSFKDNGYPSGVFEFLSAEFGISEDKDLIKLFCKNNKFNVDEDLKEKSKKFDIDIILDYKREGKKNSINDFVLYFNHRLRYFMNFFSDEIRDNLSRISQIENEDKGAEIIIAGLVGDIRDSSNGVLFNIEDKGGSALCHINKKNFELISKIELLCSDEVIAIKGKIGDNIVWVNDIYFPEFDDDKEMKYSFDENYIVCLSDLHIGACDFEDKAFDKFINFINSRSKNSKLNEVAKKIKYVLISGDLIDGIGIYPGQGKDGRYFSVEMQYRKAAFLLNQIPKDKAIIIIPGNHDTTRLSEPQLKILYDKAYSVYNLDNVLFLSNPGRFKLFGSSEKNSFDVLMYHGFSFFYYAQKIDFLRNAGGVNNLSEVQKFLLDKHHLAPSYGSSLCFPDEQDDALIIKEIPDFFISGHIHKMNFANHKNCSVLSCSGWSKQSDFQKRVGLMPDIGKCFLINTKTRKPQILNFYKEG